MKCPSENPEYWRAIEQSIIDTPEYQFVLSLSEAEIDQMKLEEPYWQTMIIAEMYLQEEKKSARKISIN